MLESLKSFDPSPDRSLPDEKTVYLSSKVRVERLSKLQMTAAHRHPRDNGQNVKRRKVANDEYFRPTRSEGH